MVGEERKRVERLMILRENGVEEREGRLSGDDVLSHTG